MSSFDLNYFACSIYVVWLERLKNIRNNIRVVVIKQRGIVRRTELMHALSSFDNGCRPLEVIRSVIRFLFMI